jgi:hypothetical protein
MLPANHTPATDSKLILVLEPAARTTLESIGTRPFTDGEWQQMRSRLVRFAHFLREWDQTISVKTGEDCVVLRHPAAGQPGWNKAA